MVLVSGKSQGGPGPALTLPLRRGLELDNQLYVVFSVITATIKNFNGVSFVN